jgi:hypothetical protein
MLVVSNCCSLLDAQRRVITNATVYANDRIQLNAISNLSDSFKLAEMATSCYAGESATIEHQKILKIEFAREAEGVSHQDAELKG